MKIPQLIFAACLAFCAAPAFADRDIVYSARYYAPPGSHRTSYFHIYRINPDGTGKTQLTFSAADDQYDPRWSADGKRITFYVNDGVGWGGLYEISADGGRRRLIKRLLEAPTIPDAPPVSGYRLENTDSAENSPTALDIDTHTLISVKTGRRLVLSVPEHDSLYDDLLPVPGGGIIYAANNHNTTVGTDYLFYKLDPATGKLRYLTEGRFLAWSPDGLRFCSAPGRDTIAYEKRPGRKDRLVWFAPLFVRAAGGGPMRQLTPRLSYVTAADWRKEK